MAEGIEPLNEDERAELERLRAEKAAWEQARPTKVQDPRQVQQSPAPKKKNIMEVDDDLSMPTGQKIVLAGVALLVIAAALMLVLSHGS